MTDDLPVIGTPIPAPRRMVGVRLTQESRDQLAALQKHYELSQSALVEYLLREEHARVQQERPPMRRGRQPLPTIPTDVGEDEIEQADTQRLAGQWASIRQAEFDRR